MQKDLKIPTPSVIEVKKYLNLWNNDKGYRSPEKSLKKLFQKTYPLNNNLDDVLVKVCALDVMYSAGAGRWHLAIAKHINSLRDIDKRLTLGDIGLIEEIRRGHSILTKRGKKRDFYSFATKYCSFHKPIIYPIYDSYVEKMLMYFKKKDKFDDFLKDDLRSSKLFKNILFNFQKHYGLEEFDFRKIDKYLHLAGKEHFSNT